MKYEDSKIAPYRGNKPFIFLSYSHKNKDKAEEIIRRLNEEGYRIWYDEGLTPGKEWNANIADKIDQCGYLFALITKHYSDSQPCRNELVYAMDKKKRVIPVYLEDIELPGSLALPLVTIRAVYRSNFKDTESFFQNIFEAEGLDEFKGEKPGVTLSGSRRQRKNVVLVALAILCVAGVLLGMNTKPLLQKENIKIDEINMAVRGDETVTELDSGSEESKEYYQKGIAAYREKDYTMALNWFLKAAVLEHADAINYLGIMHQYGYGSVEDPIKSVEYYQKAAELGNMYAQNNLGWCYRNGYGVETNLSKAFELFQQAAEQGCAQAMTNIGYCYGNGISVDRNEQKALEWYLKGAVYGDPTAMYNVGTYYHNERGGLQKNYHIAIHWYKKAAASGNSLAMRSLGSCYENGQGVEMDTAKALSWYGKAVEVGDNTAKTDIQRLGDSGKITAEDAAAWLS